MDIKKVFLDLGTHNCEGLKYFKKELDIDETWEVHAFEPNYTLDNLCWNTLGLNVTLHRSAVWIEDGDFELHLFGKDGLSQGAYIGKIGDRNYSDYHSRIPIKCINFIQFLKQFGNDKELYIKMDIEWAEYDIIKTMLAEGWKDNIKAMWVEWHGQNYEEHIKAADQLKRQIKEQTNTKLFNWI